VRKQSDSFSFFFFFSKGFFQKALIKKKKEEAGSSSLFFFSPRLLRKKKLACPNQQPKNKKQNNFFNKKMRSWVVVLLVCVCAIPILLLFIVALLADACIQSDLLFSRARLPHNHRWRWTAPELAQSSYCETWVSVPPSLTSSSPGPFRLSTLLFSAQPNQVSRRGLIFMCRGFNSNIQTGGNRAAVFVAAGFDVFLFDYRGGGKSYHLANARCPDRGGVLLDDATAQLDALFLLRRVAPAYSRIVLWGHSAGGSLASFLAACPQAPTTHGLVLENVALRLCHLTDFITPLLRPLWRLQWLALPYLRELRGQDVLIVQGELDNMLPPDNHQTFAQAAASSAHHGAITSLFLKGAGHCDQDCFAAYKLSVRTFLDALSPPKDTKQINKLDCFLDSFN